MKKRVIKQAGAWLMSLALIVSMLSAFPLAAHAEGDTGTPGSLSLQLTAQNVTSPGAAYAKPGDVIRVDVASQSAGWSGEAGQGIFGFQYRLTFDAAAVSPATGYGTGGTTTAAAPAGWAIDAVANTTLGSITVLGDVENGQSLWQMGNTLLSSSYFTVNAGVTGAIAFGIDEAAGQLVFNYQTGSEPFEFAPASVGVAATSMQVDTAPPVILLDGIACSANTTFYYKPLLFTATDEGAGFSHATFGGKAIENGATISAGGTLVVYDLLGNSASIKITLNTTLFDAAVTAIGKIPESPTLADKGKVDAARTAYDKVESTAKSKIDATRLLNGEAFLGQLEGRVDDANAAMAALPAAEAVAYTDADAIAAVRQEANDLISAGKKAADFSNYAKLTAAEAALAGIQADIAALDADMGRLPEGTAVTLGSESAATALQQRLTALRDDKQVPDTAYANLAKLQAAQVEIAAIKADALALDTQFATVSGITAATVRYADAATLAPITAEKQRLEARGVDFDDAAYTGTSAYTTAKTVVDAMLAEIAVLNTQLEALLDRWVLNNTDNYVQARADATALKSKYALEDTDLSLASVAQAEQLQLDATAIVGQAIAKAQALPMPVTNADRSAVDAVAALLDELEAAPYRIPADTLIAVMTVDEQDLYSYARRAYKLAHQPGPSTAPQNPQLANPAYDTLELTWEAVADAEGYYVYRATSNAGPYTRVGVVAGRDTCGFISSELTTGTTYYYYVTAYRTEGGLPYMSAPSQTVGQAPFTAAPQSLAVQSDGYYTTEISWDTVEGATGYRLYRWDDAKNDYVLLKEQAATRFVHTSLEPGSYQYVVSAYRTVSGKKIEGPKSTAATGAAADLSAVQNLAWQDNGFHSVKLEWTAIEGATGYQVYRWDDATGAYKLLKAVTTNSYSDVQIDAATAAYRVIAYKTIAKKTFVSQNNTDITATVTSVAAPANVYVPFTQTGTSVPLNWDFVPDASGYNIYRHNLDTDVVEFVTTVVFQSYVDNAAPMGRYKYIIASVRTINKKNFEGGRIVSTEVEVQGLNAPYLASATATALNTVKLNWAQVYDANGYNIYRLNETTNEWQLLKSVGATVTTYTDAGVAAGQQQYRIAPYRLAGKVKLDDNSASVQAEAYGIGNLQNLVATPAGYNTVKLSWDRVPDATGYDVYRWDDATGAYKLVKNIAAAATITYSDTGAPAGLQQYQVIPYRTVNKLKMQGAAQQVYAQALGVSGPLGFTAQPSGYNTVKLSWEKVDGASGYNIYRWDEDESDFVPLKAVLTLTYNDTALAGGSYRYYVAAYRTVNKVNIEGGASVQRTAAATDVAMPDLTVADGGYNAVKLSWKKVDGATGYNIYRKEEGTYKLLKAVTALTYTDSGLLGNTDDDTYNYEYRVAAYRTINKLPLEGAAASGSFAAVRNVAAPDLTAATSGYNAIKLSWPKVDGASGYTIYRSESGASGPYTIIKSVTAASYTDTPLDSGKTYHYRVAAYRTLNKAPFEGPQSNVEGALSQSVGECTSFTATPSGYNAIKLSWGKSTGTSGYNIYRRSDDEPFALLKSVTGTTYTDAGLSSDVRYKYKLVPYRTVGKEKVEGIFDSNDDAVVKGLAAPALNAPVETVNSVKLSWPKVADANGYNIYRANYVDGVYTLVKSVTTLNYTDTGLEEGTYLYKVAAYRTSGGKKMDGAVSAPVEATANVLPAPADLTVTPTAYNTLKLSWTKVDSASGYYVYYAPQGQSYSLLATIKSGATVTYTHAGMEAGSYSYIVEPYYTANKTTFNGKPSTVETGTAYSVQSPQMTAEASGYNTIKLSWPKVDGATGYNVYRSATGLEDSYTPLKSVTALTYSDTGLAADGATWYYRVAAYRTVNKIKVEGEWSPAKTAQAAGVLAPQSLDVADGGYNTVKLSWPKVDGASGYNVYRKDGGTYTLLKAVTALSYTDSGLAGNTGSNTYTYEYRVIPYRTINKVPLEGAARDASFAAVRNVAAPQVTPATSGYNAVKLSWPKVDGANGYNIYRYDSNQDDYLFLKAVTALNYTDTPLAAGSWKYQVEAYRTLNKQPYPGARSTIVTGTATKVGQPQNFTAQPNGANAAKLSWDKVTDASGYIVYIWSDYANAYVELARAGAAATSYNYSPLGYDEKTPDYAHRFCIAAYRTVSGETMEGEKSAPDDVVVVPLAAPQNVKLTASGYNTLKLTWDKVPSAVGYAVLMRNEYFPEGYIIAQITGTSYTINNLAADSVHEYKVVAYKGKQGGYFSLAGKSSAWAQGTPNPLPAPANFKVDSTSLSNAFKLSWNKVSGAVQYLIFCKYPNNSQYYYVERTTANSYVFPAMGYDDEHNSDKKYSFYVVAQTGSGLNGTGSQTVEDVHASSFPAPQNLVATATAYNTVTVSWKAVPGASAYQIWRAKGEEGFMSPYKTITGTNFTETALEAGEYRYLVAAARPYTWNNDQLKTVNYMSGDAASASCTVQDVPAATGVQAVPGAGYYQVNLSWDAVPTASGYDVFRSTQLGELGEMVTTINKAATTSYSEYLNQPLAAQYYYSVKAYTLSGGQKCYAGAAAAAPVAPKALATPAAPATVSQGNGTVLLSWTGAEGVGYYITRSTEADGTYVTLDLLLAGDSTTCSYTDTGVEPGTYYYRLVPYYRTASPVREYAGSPGAAAQVTVD